MAPGKPLWVGVLVLFGIIRWRGSSGKKRNGEEGKEGLLAAIGVISGDIQSSLLADLHGDHTLVPAANDASDTDGGAEIGLADGGVEAGCQNIVSFCALLSSRGIVRLIARCSFPRMGKGDIHSALAPISLLEVTSILNGDGLLLLRLRAGALLGGGLGNAHYCCCLREVSCVGVDVCSGDAVSREGGDSGCEAGEEHCIVLYACMEG